MRLTADSEDVFLYDPHSATTLFNIWTKYAPRLPSDYYNEKLLKVGDSLCQMKVSDSNVENQRQTNCFGWLGSGSILFLVWMFVLKIILKWIKIVMGSSNSHDDYEVSLFTLYLKFSRVVSSGSRGRLGWDGQAAQLHGQRVWWPPAGRAESSCTYLTQRSPDNTSCCF